MSTESPQDVPARDTSTNVAFSHVGIVVRDLERSVAFYRDALGFGVAEAWPVGSEFGTLMEIEGVALRSQFLRRDELAIELLCYDAPGFVGDGERRRVNQLGVNHLCFRVDDVAEAAALVDAQGGTVLDHTRTTFGEGSGLMDFVYCLDPDGTRIELMHLPG